MGPPARLFLVAALVLAAGCGPLAVTDEGTGGTSAAPSTTATPDTSTPDAATGTATPVDFEPGETVRLAFDPLTDRRGGYDRLLAYVYVDGTNLNHDLVKTGHARVFDTEFSLHDAFEASESAARSGERGLWVCRER